MYNMLKNKMSSMIFHNFKKGSYKLISRVEGKEEIYYQDNKNKLVVLIEDEEVGKRIYDVVRSLKEWGETISSEHVEIKITNYVADKYNTVQILFADANYDFENNWNQCSKLDQLQEMVSFVYGMQEKGYLLDESIFDNESCTNISDFLSYFKPNGSELESSNGCIIKYIHYVLSTGGNLEGYYEQIVKDNKIRFVNDYPYYMPVIKMCYNYYANGIIPDDIISVIKAEKVDQCFGRNLKLYTNYLVVGNSDLSSALKVVESSADYTVYDGFIKIYNEVSKNFEEFLEDDDNFIRRTEEYLMEKFSNVIINYDGKIIGYKYDLASYDKSNTLSTRTFGSQWEILLFIKSIVIFIDKMYGKSEYRYFYGKNDFNLETDLICLENNEFKVLKIENLYNLITDDRDLVEQQVTMFFFKMLNTYLENKYGKLTDKKQFLEKKEVRYLTPVVAKEFINFALGKDITIDKASEALHEFVCSNMMSTGKDLAYDVNFKYDPSGKVPFTFDYEIENKYGIQLKKDTRIELPDKRVLITFKKRKGISAVSNRIKTINDEIKQKIPSLNRRYVNLADLSEIIYSPDLNSEDMYHVVGYITSPMQGTPLTRDMILGLNNREMLRFAGKLISNFGKYYINWSSILVNSILDEDRTNVDFTFYSNILDENFSIERNYSSDSEYETVKSFFNYLRSEGYNRNAFEGIDLSRYNLQRDLISYANSFDVYCREHKIYYDSRNLLCPICKRTRVMIPDVSEIEQFSTKLLEDEYATHYSDCRFRGYNIKLYKPENIDMVMLEKNIDTILESAHDVFYQDCFVPSKKIINKEHQFIGCLYESVNFNAENCSDLADTDKLENLPRIMSLIRLASQVKFLIQRDTKFAYNPFSHVFLCKDHKKQVQILNVEFLVKKGSARTTKEWLCEYIHRIIDADSNIQLDTTRLPKKDLTGIVMTLEELSKELKMYCPIHKMFYSDKYLFCPKCVNVEHMEKFEMEYVTSSDISNWDHFNEGGESIIYSYGNGKLAKVFREEINYAFKNRILAAIFGKKEILEKINQEDHKFKYIIPRKLLVDRQQHKVIGYTMDETVEGEPIASLSDKDFVRQSSLSRKDVLEILITVGEGIETLHNKTNIYIGDLNGRNILFDKDKNVYFLDFDGMGVENIQPLFFTEEYIDPISRKNKSVTKKDDWYSLAVQAFHYLTYTHPFDGIYQISGKTLEIEERMERRISLLGKHGIKAPTIAVSWNWMNEDLKNVFYTIFETEERNSIVVELKKQYNTMYGERYQLVENAADAVEDTVEDIVKDTVVSTPVAEEIIRINSKFIAKSYNPFNCDVERIINYHSAVCNYNGDYNVVISVNGTLHRVHFLNCMEIKDILILENSSIALAVYDDIIIGFNLHTDKEVFYEKFWYVSDKAVVNGNTLYISKKSNGEEVILQIEFDSDGETNRSKIKFLSDQVTKGFLVKFNSKFMLVKQNPYGKDEIYCNSEKLCDIDSDFQDSKYNILYDDVTKLWLVVNSRGNYITIKSSNGHHKKVNIPIEINDMKLENVAFAKGILYIPSRDCVYIINVNNAMTTKQMECSKIMTSNSLLCNFNSNGFSAITEKMIYNICKE